MTPAGIDANESVAYRSSGRLRLIPLRQYALAVLSVGVALGASLILEHFHFRVPSAMLLLFAVAVSSWFGGPGPSLLAFILSTIGFYWYFVEPLRTIYIYRSEIPFFIIFTAFAALLSWFGTVRCRVEANLRQLNRKLRAITNCNQLLLRATDEQSLIDETCRIVCEEAGGRMAWVGYAQDDDVKSVRPVAWFGVEDGYLAAAKISWSEETVRGRGPGGMAIRTGRTSCSQDFATDANFAWREAALERGYHSAISLPLKDENAKTFGILTIYSTEPNAFTSEEIRLLEELAADLAFGIVTLRSRTARKQAEQALRQSEAYLAEAQRLSHTGSFAFDVASDKYVYISEECLRIFELDSQQSLPPREAVSRFIRPEDWDRVQGDFEKLLREKVDTQSEFRIVPPSGAAKHIQVIRHPVLNGVGEVVTIVGTAIDITERKRAEEALRRTAAYLAETQRLTHTGTWVVDPATEPLYWSEETFRIWGFDPQHGLPTRDQVLQRIHPEDREEFWQAFQKGIHNKVDADVEFRIVLPDGTLKHAYGQGHPVLNANGDLVELVGTTIDITQRKRAEEALGRTASYLAETQRLTHTGTYVADNTTEPLYWSDEMFRIYGFDPKDGLPTRDQPPRRIHPEDLDKFWQAWHRLIHDKVDADVEYRIVWPDGTVKHAYGLGHPVLNAHGELVEIVGTAVDITERKQAEEALWLSNAYNRGLIEASLDPLVTIGPDGKITDVNAATEAATGRSRGELTGTDFCDYFTEPANARAGYEQVFREGLVRDYPLELRHRDGRVMSVSYNAAVYRDQSGEVVGVFAAARDITERLQAEEQRERLHQLEADLAHMNRVSTMGELTASIAHEVNQPLSGVVSNASACLRWLAGKAPNLEEAREAARRIVRDGKRAAEVVARVRALTKRTAAFREKLDLNETIREVLAIVGDEAKKNSVVIRTQFADEVFAVLGDRVQLQQVVLNLLMNGIEAMSNVGEKARELTIATRNTDSDQVQVTVQDLGRGLDPDRMPKIFEPFYTTKPHGMGMGLSISRSILQAHGGQLWAAANEGPGTSFHFTIPRYHEGSRAAA